MDRILRDAASTISLELRDDAENLLDADGQAVTVTVLDDAGTEVAADLEATRASEGLYELTIPDAARSTLDRYTAEWACELGGTPSTFRTRFEVVGGFLFSIADLRAFDGELTAAEYPASQVREVRDTVAARFEKWCGVAFVPRGARVTLNGPDDTTLLLPYREVTRLVSASIDAGDGFEALTADELADVVVHRWGGLYRAASWTGGTGNVKAHVEHGYDDVPDPVHRAAMIYARSLLVASPIPDRATSETTDVGTVRFSIAGRDGPTGIPEVDAVLVDEQRDEPYAG